MDISSDSTLIATGAADRNVKLWGMDFGDCHKSIFAHDDSVTGLQFVPKTHYFFTCGKDGKVKEWDGDSYHKVQTLQVSGFLLPFSNQKIDFQSNLTLINLHIGFSNSKRFIGTCRRILGLKCKS